MHQERSDADLLQVINQRGGGIGALSPEARQALGELIARHYPWALRFAYFELRRSEVATDCVQEIMIEVAKNIKSFQGSAQFTTWLYTLAKRVIWRWKTKEEKRRRFQENDHSTRTTSTPSAEDSYLHELQKNVLLSLVQELPERQREAVFLHYYEELSLGEAAQRAGCSTGTMKTHLFRARQALAEKIEQRNLELTLEVEYGISSE